jgi:hypothetical protein
MAREGARMDATCAHGRTLELMLEFHVDHDVVDRLEDVRSCALPLPWMEGGIVGSALVTGVATARAWPLAQVSAHDMMLLLSPRSISGGSHGWKKGREGAGWRLGMDSTGGVHLLAAQR